MVRISASGGVFGLFYRLKVFRLKTFSNFSLQPALTLFDLCLSPHISSLFALTTRISERMEDTIKQAPIA